MTRIDFSDWKEFVIDELFKNNEKLTGFLCSF